MAENQYQSRLIKKLKNLFPDCEILKNDSSYKQGILDLTLLFPSMWAMLEVKDSVDAPIQPNQEYYVNHFNNMQFAAFIYPENEAEVLDALQQALETSRRACVP